MTSFLTQAQVGHTIVSGADISLNNEDTRFVRMKIKVDRFQTKIIGIIIVYECTFQGWSFSLFNQKKTEFHRMSFHGCLPQHENRRQLFFFSDIWRFLLV